MISFTEKMLNDFTLFNMWWKATSWYENDDNDYYSNMDDYINYEQDQYGNNILVEPPSQKHLNDTSFTIKQEGKWNDVHRLAMKKHRNEQYKQHKNSVSLGRSKKTFKQTKTKKGRIDLSSEY